MIHYLLLLYEPPCPSVGWLAGYNVLKRQGSYTSMLQSHHLLVYLGEPEIFRLQNYILKHLRILANLISDFVKYADQPVPSLFNDESPFCLHMYQFCYAYVPDKFSFMGLVLDKKK